MDVIVTTRHGGVSRGPYATLNLGLHVGDDHAAVVENRRRAAAALGLELADLVFCEQCHSATAVVVGGADRGRGTASRATAVPGADALVTAERGVGLVVMVADCAPIVLIDARRRVLAVVHAGWRGTVAGVVPAALERMRELGSAPGDVTAAVGPAVSAETYEVGPDVVGAVRQRYGEHAERLLRPAGDRHLFDLAAASRLELERAGVARMLVTGETTGAGTDFFSARAEQPTGRFALLARLA